MQVDKQETTALTGAGESATGDRAWLALAADRPLHGLTVLLVEDSRLASEAMRLMCLRSGARIRRADSIGSAARHLRTYRPGVVIIDMGLPDGDGAALIAQITATLPRVPVVLGLSGDPGRKAAALAAGADGFLAKPVAHLAQFQQAILALLPERARMQGPRLLPDTDIAPDPAALQDDLAYLAQMLVPGMDGALRAYAAQFLAGLGVVAGDAGLDRAAAQLAQQGDDGVILRLRALIEHRLAGDRLM